VSLDVCLNEPETYDVLPCCGKASMDAVSYNPFNRVIQCHICGETYQHFVPWIERYLAACADNPEAVISVSR